MPITTDVIEEDIEADASDEYVVNAHDNSANANAVHGDYYEAKADDDYDNENDDADNDDYANNSAEFPRSSEVPTYSHIIPLLTSVDGLYLPNNINEQSLCRFMLVHSMGVAPHIRQPM